MGIINKIKSNPKLKSFVLWMIMPKYNPKPRLWVRLFINPLKHKKGKASVVRRRTRMDVFPFNNFTMGNNSTIESFSTINNGVGEVKIGNRTRVGMSNTIIGPVTLGNNINIAQNVVMSGLNHGYEDINTPPRDQPVSTATITVEDDCWIGANSVITAGVTIGKHCVVAGGSVVTKDVPPYSIVGGNPARILKQYNNETKVWERIKS